MFLTCSSPCYLGSFFVLCGILIPLQVGLELISRWYEQAYPTFTMPFWNLASSYSNIDIVVLDLSTTAGGEIRRCFSQPVPDCISPMSAISSCPLLHSLFNAALPNAALPVKFQDATLLLPMSRLSGLQSQTRGELLPGLYASEFAYLIGSHLHLRVCISVGRWRQATSGLLSPFAAITSLA